MKIGDRVRKVKGLPFGGGKCPHCDGQLPYAVVTVDPYPEGGGERLVARHPDGWSHIFNPEQLEIVEAGGD